MAEPLRVQAGYGGIAADATEQTLTSARDRDTREGRLQLDPALSSYLQTIEGKRVSVLFPFCVRAVTEGTRVLRNDEIIYVFEPDSF